MKSIIKISAEELELLIIAKLQPLVSVKSIGTVTFKINETRDDTPTLEGAEIDVEIS